MKRIRDELQKCMREIERFVENSKTPRELINLKRRKIGMLGGHVKKDVIPLKRKMSLEEKRKQKKASKREEMECKGILCRKRRTSKF